MIEASLLKQGIDDLSERLIGLRSTEGLDVHQAVPLDASNQVVGRTANAYTLSGGEVLFNLLYLFRILQTSLKSFQVQLQAFC